jgi:hypothetical protein
VDRGNPWLGRSLNSGDQLGQRGRFGRAVELGDVGAPNEQLARTLQNHRRHRGVSRKLIGQRQKLCTDGRFKRVHWRVVDGKDGDAAFAVEYHGHLHVFLDAGSTAFRPLPQQCPRARWVKGYGRR